MIKFIAKLGMNRHLVGLGLSSRNIDLLLTDKPIVIDLQDEFGLPPIQIMLFAGETEESMKATLNQFMGPETVIIDRKKGVNG